MEERVHETEEPRWRWEVLEQEGGVDEDEPIGLPSHVQLDQSDVQRHEQIAARRVAHHAHFLAGPS